MARCALAFCLAETNQREAARVEFEYLSAAGFAAIPRKHAWYPAMALLTEVCCYLGDAERAAQLYRQMLPYAERNVVLDLHVSFGPMARYLGLLASVMNRFAEAEQHLQAAFAMNRRMGSRQWLAHTHFDYAALLLKRGGNRDLSEALKHLDTAIEIASSCAMTRLAEQASALRAASSSAPDAAAPAADTIMLRKEGDYWTVGRRAKLFRVKDLKGLAYIQQLTAHPHHEIFALDLMAGFQSGEPTATDTAALESGLRAGLPEDAGEMLDEQAKAAYSKRLTLLRDELEDALELQNSERAELLKDEIDALSRELGRAVGLGGRDRRAASSSERARISVTRAIKAAVEKITENDAELGDLLARTVRTGTYCVYVPDPKRPLSWNN